MKKNKFFLNKKLGETPLEVLERFRSEHASYKDDKLTYAGRLDPMAEGLLLVLSGEECKNKNYYLNLDKEYEFEILLGFKTDTKDVLGLAEEIIFEYKKENIKENIKKITGKREMEYPVYSSKTVNGKALFEYAKNGDINNIKIPKKKIEIYNIKFLNERVVLKEVLVDEIIQKINLVKEGGKNDNFFRKDVILKQWEEVFENIDNKKEFIVLKFKTTVSSGTYIRVLSEYIAKNIFNSSGLAFSIKRTKIGKVKKFFNINFLFRLF